MKTGEVYNFVLYHGSAQDKKSMEPLSHAIRGSGHNTLTLRLPIEDPSLNIDDYAQTGMDVISNLEGVVLVGHSMGGTVIDRVAVNELEAEQLKGRVKISSGTEVPEGTTDDDEPAKYLPGFLGSRIDNHDGTYSYDKNLARTELFSGCGSWIPMLIRQLRRQTIDYGVGSLERTSDSPVIFFNGRKERVLNLAWLRHTHRYDEASKQGDAKEMDLDGGHFLHVILPHVITYETLNFLKIPLYNHQPKGRELNHDAARP
jgi:hypothetical protein